MTMTAPTTTASTPLRAGAPGTPRFSSVRLVIHRIVAHAGTREIDKDEIVLTAIETVGEVIAAGAKPTVRAKSRRGQTIDAGKFKKGDQRHYDVPRAIASFPLGPRGGDWPRTAQATLLLIEKDEGQIGNVVAAVVDAIDDDLGRAIAGMAAGLATTVATAALAGSAAGSAVPLVGTVIGAAAAAANAAAFGAIRQARKDDLFPLKPVRHELAAYPQRAGTIEGSRHSARFQAKGGDYEVTYSWEVV
jgi:hypothetical protein